MKGKRKEEVEKEEERGDYIFSSCVLTSLMSS
jgi:hypothetical protein